MKAIQYRRLRIGWRALWIEEMKLKRAAHTAMKYIFLIAVAIALFYWGKGQAYKQRGYEAYGGEYLLLLLPLIWYAIETTVRDYIKEAKKLWKEAKSIEDQEHCADMQKE